MGRDPLEYQFDSQFHLESTDHLMVADVGPADDSDAGRRAWRSAIFENGLNTRILRDQPDLMIAELR